MDWRPIEIAMRWTHNRYAKNKVLHYSGSWVKTMPRKRWFKGRQTMFKEHLKELMEKQRQNEGNAKE